MERITGKKGNEKFRKNRFSAEKYRILEDACKPSGPTEKLRLRRQAMLHMGTFRKGRVDTELAILYLPVKLSRLLSRLFKRR